MKNLEKKNYILTVTLKFRKPEQNGPGYLKLQKPRPGWSFRTSKSRNRKSHTLHANYKYLRKCIFKRLLHPFFENVLVVLTILASYVGHSKYKGLETRHQRPPHKVPNHHCCTCNFTSLSNKLEKKESNFTVNIMLCQARKNNSHVQQFTISDLVGSLLHSRF